MSLFFLSGMQVSLPLFRSSESYSCIYHLDPAVSRRLFSEWKSQQEHMHKMTFLYDYKCKVSYVCVVISEHMG
jgi:hypothetical protein